MNMRDGSTRGLLVAILLLSLPALAYEGSSTVNFNVTGTIEAPSCEVAVEPSNSIDLGTVSSQTFSGHAGASGAIASKSQLSFSDPVATVSAKDKKGTIAISQLHISGTTSIQLIPMGCIVGSNNLSFSMGSINASEFNTATKVGSARQSLSLSCEPGTNVSMRVAAASASGDNPDNTVMALTAEQNAATGVGVQLNLNGKALPLNTDISLYTSSRATVTNSGADASYSYFTNPDSPGGAAAMQTLALSTNYYRTGSAVTAGTANATGVITFTYN